MDLHRKFYIDGAFVDPLGQGTIDVVNPATETVTATISAGTPEDIDRAVRAADRAFPAFAATTVEARIALLEAILVAFDKRADAFAEAMMLEMGTPIRFSREAQVWAGRAHFEAMITVLKSFEFHKDQGTTRIAYEPIGVCGLITPWNWPLNQITCKVAPALAAGCTMVLKPSECSPLSSLLLAEAFHEAGVPAGVFNLVNGDGVGAGAPLTTHPLVQMVSFTGSTRAGRAIGAAAADSVKRVTLELGGKSPNIILDDADLEAAVTGGVKLCFANSGQSCDAPTRMLVPAHMHDEACAIAKRAADALVSGDPAEEATDLGPVVNARQFENIQRLIQAGIDDSATLVCGGVGRPNGLNQGYYVKPTVFGNVRPGMVIEREEVFGPVLAIMPYETEAEAIRMANDTPYGLAGFVQSGSLERARGVAAQIRAGAVNIGYPDWDLFSPFGGYKQSGNGREYGAWGLQDYLEAKSMIGFRPATA